MGDGFMLSEDVGRIGSALFENGDIGALLGKIRGV
jgi:hypothetical protein